MHCSLLTAGYNIRNRIANTGNMNVYVTIDNFPPFLKLNLLRRWTPIVAQKITLWLLFSLLGGTFSMPLQMNTNDGRTGS
jgi:hypothetical protein